MITPISGLHHPGGLGHHHNCIKIWLTGGKLGPTDRNTISVDQKMAEVTAQYTRYPSMEVAITQESLAWTADGVRLPAMQVPREEYLFDGTFNHEDRFPTPAIFPKY